eukprot:GHVS01082676.1.p1 GENE.GHVS01082676.1~~GHVS01082676.1.p1  ORF type:complete len:137 (-),score=2.32 GHVS01082676.1:61-471(-)
MYICACMNLYVTISVYVCVVYKRVCVFCISRHVSRHVLFFHCFHIVFTTKNLKLFPLSVHLFIITKCMCSVCVNVFANLLLWCPITTPTLSQPPISGTDLHKNLKHKLNYEYLCILQTYCFLLVFFSLPPTLLPPA